MAKKSSKSRGKSPWPKRRKLGYTSGSGTFRNPKDYDFQPLARQQADELFERVLAAYSRNVAPERRIVKKELRQPYDSIRHRKTQPVWSTSLEKRTNSLRERAEGERSSKKRFYRKNRGLGIAWCSEKPSSSKAGKARQLKKRLNLPTSGEALRALRFRVWCR